MLIYVNIFICCLGSDSSLTCRSGRRSSRRSNGIGSSRLGRRLGSTTQIVSLARILLDSYYRKTNGFHTLLEKEWLAFGHHFSERNKQTTAFTLPNFPSLSRRFLSGTVGGAYISVIFLFSFSFIDFDTVSVVVLIQRFLLGGDLLSVVYAIRYVSVRFGEGAMHRGSNSPSR